MAFWASAATSRRIQEASANKHTSPDIYPKDTKLGSDIELDNLSPAKLKSRDLRCQFIAEIENRKKSAEMAHNGHQ